MRLRALASIGLSLCIVSLSAQVPDARLDRALERIERNDDAGLRRLLSDEPSLVRQTGAGLLPHWRWTLLHKATAERASLGVVRALVDAGSDVNAQDDEGNTPLHFAMKRLNGEKLPTRDYEGIIRLLLEKKADVHIVNIAGATPLHTASAFRADPSAVEMLIHAGADVNLKTLPSHGGWTPLHGAVERNSAGIAGVLLKYGADLSVRDSKELRPIQVAVRGGFDETVNVIRAYAAAHAANSGAVPTMYVPPDAGLPASSGGVVQGRVLWNDQPLAGAIVYVADIPRHGSAHYGTTTTDDQGRFSMTGVPPGNRYVDVKGDQRVFMITADGEPFVTSERSIRPRGCQTIISTSARTSISSRPRTASRLAAVPRFDGTRIRIQGAMSSTSSTGPVRSRWNGSSTPTSPAFRSTPICRPAATSGVSMRSTPQGERAGAASRRAGSSSKSLQRHRRGERVERVEDQNALLGAEDAARRNLEARPAEPVDEVASCKAPAVVENGDLYARQEELLVGEISEKELKVEMLSDLAAFDVHRIWLDGHPDCCTVCPRAGPCRRDAL
jgi:ankyrin repeat protein